MYPYLQAFQFYNTSAQTKLKQKHCIAGKAGQ